MTTEKLLFCLAVFGNLILFYYTIKVGFHATRLVRSGDRFGALCKALAASALAGLTVLLPWTLISGDQVIGKIALLICLVTPLVVSGVKLWAFESRRSARSGIRVVRDAERERLHDPFGYKSGHPSADLNDPCNPLWPGHHHS